MNWLVNFGLGFALIVPAVGCASHLTTTQTASSLTLRPAEDVPALPGDRFAAGDLAEIRIFGEDELSATYRLGANGTIDFPFLGPIAAEGLTAAQLKERLEGELVARDVLANPQIYVAIAESNARHVNVVGAVESPGSFPYVSGMTIVQALSLAGGFSAIASQNQTVVSRRVDGRIQRFNVPVRRIAEGKEQDFVLTAGDIIFVPERVF